jgi:hypothetical protein
LLPSCGVILNTDQLSTILHNNKEYIRRTHVSICIDQNDLTFIGARLKFIVVLKSVRCCLNFPINV